MNRYYKKKPIRVPRDIRLKRLRRCRSGKRTFKTLVDAKIFLARIQLKNKNEQHCGYHKIPVRAYHCSGCGMYHVTSKAKWYN